MRVALGDRHLYDRRQSNLEKKVSARQKILDFMLNQESTTKAELAKSLDLSMPTVLSGIADLTEKGLVIEAGEMESTGGRRARRIALQEDYCLSVGVDITAHHSMWLSPHRFPPLGAPRQCPMSQNYSRREYLWEFPDGGYVPIWISGLRSVLQRTLQQPRPARPDGDGSS